MEIHLRTVVVDCEDAHRAAHFYSKLLGWPITLEEPDWVLLRDPKGGTGLSFQTEEDYVRPVWPEEPRQAHEDAPPGLPGGRPARRCGPRFGLRGGQVPPAVFGGPGRHRVFRHRRASILPVPELTSKAAKKGRASQAGGPSLFRGNIFREELVISWEIPGARWCLRPQCSAG